MPVGRLAVGDRLLALTGVAVPALVCGPGGDEAVDVRQEPVALRSIADHAADPTTPLFNLHVDGDRTYFADDWLVHNKAF